MKVTELTGVQLDYWVAKAAGYYARIEKNEILGCQVVFAQPFAQDEFLFEPSTEWAHGGPLIDKFNIDLLGEHDGTFWAQIDGPASVPESDLGAFGSTRLEAAMRCIVESVYFGAVPDEVAA